MQQLPARGSVDDGIVAFVQDIREGDARQAQHAPLCVKP
jgi:hypothetical protein